MCNGQRSLEEQGRTGNRREVNRRFVNKKKLKDKFLGTGAY
jgi:hypothetical protein